jgi:hypothetical protein
VANTHIVTPRADFCDENGSFARLPSLLLNVHKDFLCVLRHIFDPGGFL